MRAVSFDRGRWRASTQRVRRRFHRYSEKLHSLLREEVKAAARVTGEALTRLTFPNRYGVRLLKIAIASDLRTLYATPSWVYSSVQSRYGLPAARAFYAAFMSGNYGLAQKILADLGHPWASLPMGTLDPSYHDPARNTKGRVTVAKPAQIVPSQDLAAYTRLAYDRMGKTASGWAACLVILGGEGGIPRFKSTAMHGARGGTVDVISTPTRHVVILVNNRPLARRHISPGQIKRAVGYGRDYLAWALRRR